MADRRNQDEQILRKCGQSFGFDRSYGVDAVRFYLMREMVLGLDANFTPDSFIKCYNSDLANDFGNLLNRVSGLIQKNHGGQIPEPGYLTRPRKTLKRKRMVCRPVSRI